MGPQVGSGVASPPGLPASAECGGPTPLHGILLAGYFPTLAEIESWAVREALQATFYNQRAAARRLGIDRHVLARKMWKHGISLPGDISGTPCAAPEHGIISVPSVSNQDQTVMFRSSISGGSGSAALRLRNS
jgi:hypothetical protein